MEKQLLIQYDSNWADEFDLEGFVVMSESKWNNHKDAIQKRFDALPRDKDQWGNSRYELKQYFGTNEDQTWSNMDQYLAEFKVTELSESDLQVLKKFFSHGNQISNGMVVMLDEEE